MDIGGLGLHDTLLLALDEERGVSNGAATLHGEVAAADELRSRAGAAPRRVVHRRDPTVGERLRDLLAAFGLYQPVERDASEQHLSLRSDT